ncbi:hypothetical protein ASG90_01180 [Nocardioides sp. Soil797]|nr:hypothetical protein ASG90_01180 [Nocardioides sp. Soil797]
MNASARLGRARLGEPRLGRAPWTTAGELDPDQARLKEQIDATWGGGAVGLSPIDPSGRLVGPFDLMAASPHVGAAVLALASSFRDAELSVAERELVILVVAVAERADFMWEGHLPVGVAAGMSTEIGEALRRGETPQLGGPLATVHRVARALIDDGDLDDATFESAVEELGWPRVQEIVWLTGLYQAFGLAMRVARTPLPEQEDT